MKLKRQGFYREMLHGDKGDPSILQFIRDKGELDEDKIYRYLKAGIIVVACGGIVKGIVDSNNGIAGCPDMLTDGISLWPGDLAYYVKKYHLKLDEDSLQSMRDNEWCIKNIPSIDYDNLEII